MRIKTLEIKRIKEYRENGCNFKGNLVLVEYYEVMKQEPRWGQYGACISDDYVKKARELVESKFIIEKELLNIPDFVCIVKD